MNKVKFDGEDNSTLLERITAKKNFASSMQSHKMGATYMFDAIHKYLSKEKYPNLANEVNGPVAVKQLPVVGFTKTLKEGTKDIYIHKYIGNYTVGADKGDNGYFGFDDPAVTNTAIRLEGTDHIRGVGFNYPWRVNGVDNIKYSADKEALCIVTGLDVSTWSAILEQSKCGNYKSESDINDFLVQEFKPAFDCAYYNNPLIVGVDDMTIDEINANITAFGKRRRTTDDRQYSYCEFWIDGEYDLYYLNLERNRYEKNGINLYRDLSTEEQAAINSATTLEEKNQIFINFRVKRFAEQAPNYFEIDDGDYQLGFLYINGASDNGEKNMYPYKFKLLSEGGRWRFFQDDLDSIGPTDNQAQDTKTYSIELHDFTSEDKSAYVFKGEDNAFFQLLELSFATKYQQMCKDILLAMIALASRGNTNLEKLMAFYDDYFFSRAQEYFAKSLYNNDAEQVYEEAWNDKNYVAVVDIHPLAQSLGDHYEAEREWFEKRMIYLMSKFSIGGFSDNNDTELGIISFRTQEPRQFELTPVIDLYPTALGGQGQLSKSNERIKSGQSILLTAVGGGNTNAYIVGVDWLSDIGDLRDLVIDPNAVSVLNIASKRLRRIKLGDEDASTVTTTLESLAIQQCNSLETIDARNASKLGGTIDLTKCPRIIEALFGGTNISAVLIVPGSKIEKLEIPSSITTLDLRNIKFMDTFNHEELNNLRYIRLENVQFNGFEFLKEAYNSENQSLQDIRIIGFNYTGETADLKMLTNFANNLDKDGNEHIYKGIDINGNNTQDNPVLEGSLHIAGNAAQVNIDLVNSKFPAIILTADKIVNYFEFVDKEVERIVAENWGDGTGTSLEQIHAVTDIGTVFKDNTVIETFNELEKFTNVTELKHNAFSGCTSLTDINTGKIQNLRNNVFKDCQSLKGFESEYVVGVGTYCFQGCTALEGVNLPNVVSAYGGMFNQCTSLKNIKMDNLKSIQEIGQTFNQNNAALISFYAPKLENTVGLMFGECTSLKDVSSDMWNSLKTIAERSFYDCTSLEIEDLSLPNLETLGQNAFYGVSIKKISDLGKITALPAATTTSQNFGRKDVLEEVVLPDSVTIIPANSFDGYSSLVKVHLSDSVTEIGNYAFRKCVNIEQINIPNSVEILGRDAFYNNTKLNGDLTLSAIKTIGESGLRNTSFSSVETGSSIEEVGSNAFMDCSKLNLLIFRAITPPTLGSNAFNNTNNCPIYVPDASVEAYKTATNWVTYADRIMSMFYYLGYIDFADSAVRDICVANFDTDADGVVSIEEAAAVTDIGTIFQNKTNITSFDEFKWFTGVTKLVAGAFNKCSNLKVLTLPISITSIPAWSNVFVGTSIESINIPPNCNIVSDQLHIPSLKRITLMGKGYVTGQALSYCPNVQELLLDKNNTYLKVDDNCLYSADGATFYGMINSRLTNPNLEGVTTLVDGVFYGSKVGGKITLPSSVTKSGNNGATFQYSSYEKVVIEGLSAIRSFDLANMPNLTYIILRNAQSISYNVFNGSNNIKGLIIDKGSVCSLSTKHGLISTANVYVPNDLLDTYKTASEWVNISSQIKPINVADTLPDIGSVAENDLYKIGKVYWKAELVDSVLTWVNILDGTNDDNGGDSGNTEYNPIGVVDLTKYVNEHRIVAYQWSSNSVEGTSISTSGGTDSYIIPVVEGETYRIKGNVALANICAAATTTTEISAGLPKSAFSPLIPSSSSEASASGYEKDITIPQGYTYLYVSSRNSNLSSFVEGYELYVERLS